MLRKWILKILYACIRKYDTSDIQKGFPNYKDGRPYGWEDRGETPNFIEYNPKSELISVYTGHIFCSTRVSIGIENGVPFKFCPKCLVKTEDSPVKPLAKKGLHIIKGGKHEEES